MAVANDARRPFAPLAPLPADEVAAGWRRSLCHAQIRAPRACCADLARRVAALRGGVADGRVFRRRQPRRRTSVMGPEGPRGAVWWRPGPTSALTMRAARISSPAARAGEGALANPLTITLPATCPSRPSPGGRPRAPVLGDTPPSGVAAKHPTGWRRVSITAAPCSTLLLLTASDFEKTYVLSPRTMLLGEGSVEYTMLL